MLPFFIESLSFSGGQTVPLERGTTLLLVGPNNSGKSAALREVSSHLAYPSERPNEVVLRDISFSHVFSSSELLTWLVEYHVAESTSAGVIRITMPQGGMWQASATSSLESMMPMAHRLLIRRLDTESRLTYANSVGPIDVYREVPRAPIHWLQRRESLGKEVSEVVRSAFGEELIINWGRGSSVGFHVGTEPARSLEQDRVSQRYLEELNRVPRLEELGDGIRSFVSSVLAAKVGAHPIVLIDEPEAFLYPTQAWRLGQFLAKEIGEQRRQAIIATHSPDVIRGVLQGSSSVAICRIERKENVNNACVLDTRALRELWSSPLLQSSQAISGLFHEGVAICEADSDCRVYGAIVSAIDKTLSKPADLYFVHGGGKGALASLAKAYTALSVKTAVIADLDLLRNADEFFAVYENLGGSRPGIDSSYRVTASALGAQGPILSLSQFLSKTRMVLETIENEKQLAVAHRRKIQELLDSAGDWSDAKRYGTDKLQGSNNTAATALLEACARVGLFLVPKGELESWWRAGPSDKREWVSAALEQISRDPAPFDQCEQFMRKVCGYFGY